MCQFNAVLLYSKDNCISPYITWHNHLQHLLPYWVNRARRLGLWGSDIPAQAERFYRLQRHEWICQNAQASSLPNQWWGDGLYLSRGTFTILYVSRCTAD